jgi:hypothetical protein
LIFCLKDLSICESVVLNSPTITVLESICIMYSSVCLMKLGVYSMNVGHACNPNYSGGRHWNHHGLRPGWAKNLQDSISANKLGVVVHACDSN